MINYSTAVPSLNLKLEPLAPKPNTPKPKTLQPGYSPGETKREAQIRIAKGLCCLLQHQLRHVVTSAQCELWCLGLASSGLGFGFWGSIGLRDLEPWELRFRVMELLPKLTQWT